MAVHFLTCELAAWDEATSDALVLTFFSDERPLRGAAGLADWRLCGRLSRLIRAGRVRGERGDDSLMPPGRRLPFRMLLLFGLGRSEGFDEATFRTQVRRIREVTTRAGVRDYAVQPPGRATGLIAARRALELWLDETGLESDGAGEIALIDSQAAHREMADILTAHERVARRRRTSTGNPVE